MLELIYATQGCQPHRSCADRSLSRFQSIRRPPGVSQIHKGAESTTSGAFPPTGGWRAVHRLRRPRQ